MARPLDVVDLIAVAPQGRREREEIAERAENRQFPARPRRQPAGVVALFARQRQEAEIEVGSTTEPVRLADVVVVEHRSGERNRVLIDVLVLVVEVVGVGGGVIASAKPFGEQPGNQARRAPFVETVLPEVGAVRAPVDVEARPPGFVDVVEGLAPNMAARAVIGRVGDAAAEIDIAVGQRVTVLALQQRPFLAGHGGGDGQVLMRRDRPEVGNLEDGAKVRGQTEKGREDTGLALDGRIRLRQVGRVEDRDAGDLQPGVFELDDLLVLIVDHLDRLDLPQWRSARVLLADVAGRVHRFVQFGSDAIGTARAGGGEAPAIGEDGAEVLDDPVLQVAGDLQVLREVDIARGRKHGNVPRSGHQVFLLVVGDGVCEEDIVAARGLDVAAGAGDAEFPVVGHFIRGEQDRSVVRGQIGGGGDREHGQQGGQNRERRPDRCPHPTHCLSPSPTDG